jgi:hypothetical protein
MIVELPEALPAIAEARRQAALLERVGSMPRERRQIALLNDELIEALRSYRRLEPTFLPRGEIVECTVAMDRSVVVRLEKLDRSMSKPVEVRLSPADLVEPLIRFCIENNIKLPRAGIKSVGFSDGELALCIRMNWPSDDEELDFVEEPRLRAVSA